MSFGLGYFQSVKNGNERFQLLFSDTVLDFRLGRPPQRLTPLQQSLSRFRLLKAAAAAFGLRITDELPLCQGV